MEYVGCIILFMPFTKYQASGGKYLSPFYSKNMSRVESGFLIIGGQAKACDWWKAL